MFGGVGLVGYAFTGILDMGGTGGGVFPAGLPNNEAICEFNREDILDSSLCIAIRSGALNCCLSSKLLRLSNVDTNCGKSLFEASRIFWIFADCSN
jgi:hypothetical protein